MKIKINRKVFADALNRVGKCAAKSPVLPQLSNVLLATMDNAVILTATDLEQRITVSANAEVIEHGTTTLNVKKLLSLSNSMSGETIEMETDENHHSTIKSGRTKAKLFGIAPDDFPEDVEFAPVVLEKLNTPDVIQMVKHGAYTACPAEARRALQGALFHFSDNEITVVSTDSKRLAKSSVPAQNLFPQEAQFILPVCGINFLQQLNADETELGFSEKHFYCKSGNVMYTCKLIEGQFPNWQMVVPKTFKTTVNLDIEKFVSALKTVTVVRGDQPLVSVTIDQEKLELKSEDKESGVITDFFEIAGDNPANANFEPMTIQLNAQFVLDALTAAGGKGKTQLNINDAMTPLQFDFDNSFAIIMPVRSK